MLKFQKIRKNSLLENLCEQKSQLVFSSHSRIFVKKRVSDAFDVFGFLSDHFLPILVSRNHRQFQFICSWDQLTNHSLRANDYLKLEVILANGKQYDLTEQKE